jgi:hypothetical protein
VVAVGLNVDSFAIGSRLWKDEAVRAAVAEQAQKVTDATECPSAEDASGSAGAEEKGPLEKIAGCVTAVEALGLPIGWAEENRPDSAGGWLAKLGGVAITVFALMLGAPFWFDTLSKLARLRNTGKPEGTAKGDTGKPQN